MSKNSVILNNFAKGLDWDSHLTSGDNSNYKYALNIINNDHKQNTFISNEHSNRLVATYGSNIVGRKYINKINSTVVFLANGELHLFNHDTKSSKFIASDTEFSCDWGFSSCEWIQAWDYDQYICDLWITYSSNKVYYNLNLSELLDPVRKEGLKKSLSEGCGEGCTVRTCDYFKVFKKSCDPHIEAVVLEGGSLRNGTYFIGGRYRNNKGGYSNPFPMTPALHVGGNNNIPGEISNKRIEITVQNTSCVFDQIEYFVHEIINGATITKALSPQYISGKSFTVTYTGTESLPPIDSAELLINSRTYIEGEDLLIHNNRALYYRTTPEFEYNFQPIANQVQVGWYAMKVPLADVKAYGLKSFYRGETYAFSLSPNYDNGKKGYGFHIPAISGGGDCSPTPYSGPDTQTQSASSNQSSSEGINSLDQSLFNIVPSNEVNLSVNGCEGDTFTKYYIDTVSFCTATKLYTDSSRTILAPAEEYKIELNQDSFVRPWDGEEFTTNCNICISDNGGGGGGGQNASTKASISGSTSIGGSVNINIKLGVMYERLRQEISNSTVNNPSEPKMIDIVQETVESWNTDINDVTEAIGPGMDPETGCVDCGGEGQKVPKDELNQFANVKDDLKDEAIAKKNAPDAEKIGATWYKAVSNYIFETKKAGKKPGFTESDNNVVGMSPAQILDNPITAVGKFRQAAKDLITAIEKRERFNYKYEPHNITGKGAFNYSNDSLVENNQHKQEFSRSVDKGIQYDDAGNLIAHSTQTIKVAKSIYKKYPIVARGKCKPRHEKNSKYPCIVDCNGNYIYCGLQGQTVTHHEMPTNSEVPFWVPKSTGDGATYQTDSNIMDGYAILLGVEFTNINIPDTVKAKLCPTNPYNIGMVIRGSSNSRMILKGLATETYNGTNQGKNYVYFKYGVNSREKVSKYIDVQGRRFGGTSNNTSNVTMYSLDQLVRRPYLNGTHLIREGIMTGTGARHMLYSKGLEPNDPRASRQDQGGSVHTVMMHSFSPSNTRLTLEGQTYAGANQAISPPTGASVPLMNNSGQACAWLIAPGAGQGIDDDSFVGDVLQDQAPITNARGGYFSVYRDLEDQYGDISSLNYTTILQARGYDLAVSGLVGDTYIGPYSFVKTGYVSDKVGNYFPIGSFPGLTGKVDRCICDDPEDAVHSLAGQWYWKALPKDGDAADAKRWAGTHTNPITKTWQQSVNQDTESHYYYPGTTKHLITYVGESEANPWLREKSNLLENQWYPEIKPLFSLHSKDITGGDWKVGYLNLYYKLIEQASSVKLGLKVLIKSFINIALPVLGIKDWLSPESGIEFAGDMAGAVIQMAVWLLVSQVLFTNDFVDKFLGLEACKKDEDGGEDQKIEKWFVNYSNYNNDYSIDNFDPTIVGLPMEYTGCICTDLTMNKVYISDENDTSYYVNGYQVVRPNSAIMLEESFGKLTKMYSMGTSLYLHTTDAIYKSNIGSIQIPTNIGDLLMGSPNMITVPQLITNSSSEGQFGLDHPNHGVMTGLGFLFVDYNSQDLILFTGDSFDVLSGENYKMSRFFKEYLKFCTTNSCKFEQKENTPHYAIGIDYRYKRILFTKSDGDNSYTLSYSMRTKNWVSFHSYVPQEYLYDRNDLYTLYRNSIWLHDVTDKYTTYYGEFKGCMIDLIATIQPSNLAGQINYTMDWQSTDINTEAVINNTRDRDITFDTVALLNSWQSTGYINLNVVKNTDNNSANKTDYLPDKTTSIDLTRSGNAFRFSELRDYTQDYNSPILITTDCKPEPVIQNYGNTNEIAKQNYMKKIVSDNYLYYRFIFSKFADVKLYIKNIISYVKENTY